MIPFDSKSLSKLFKLPCLFRVPLFTDIYNNCGQKIQGIVISLGEILKESILVITSCMINGYMFGNLSVCLDTRLPIQYRTPNAQLP